MTKNLTNLPPELLQLIGLYKKTEDIYHVYSSSRSSHEPFITHLISLDSDTFDIKELIMACGLDEIHDIDTCIKLLIGHNLGLFDRYHEEFNKHYDQFDMLWQSNIHNCEFLMVKNKLGQKIDYNKCDLGDFYTIYMVTDYIINNIVPELKLTYDSEELYKFMKDHPEFEY